MITADQFFVKYNLKYIDYDGYYGYQCMDLYRQFVKEVYGCQQSPPVRGAANVWTTYNSTFFDRIPNGPVNYPQKGDIIIWDTRAGGGFGHIAIAMDARSYDFNSFDQNWPVGSRCHKQPHNYKYVLGWLTPKKKVVEESVTINTSGQAPAASPQTETPSNETADIPPQDPPTGPSSPSDDDGTVHPTPSPDTTGTDSPTDTVGNPVPQDGTEIPTPVQEPSSFLNLLIEFLKKHFPWLFK